MCKKSSAINVSPSKNRTVVRPRNTSVYLKHNSTYDTPKPNKNNVIIEEVAKLIDSLLVRFEGDALKFLPNLLLSKLTYTLLFYKNKLMGCSIPVRIPTDLADDGEIQAISKCADVMELCHTYEPFLRRMIRLINHYAKQPRSDMDLLSMLLTFYRHLIEAGRYSDYWSRSCLKYEKVRSLEEFREGFSQLVN